MASGRRPDRLVARVAARARADFPLPEPSSRVRHAAGSGAHLSMTSCLIREAEIKGQTTRVRLRDGRIEAVDPALEPDPGEVVVEAEGGALLPGLRDHHIHLLALAAARESVACGPPQVQDRRVLKRALRQAPGSETSPQLDSTSWIRGVGYHESVAGDLDRDGLDALINHRPVRIQHRSGALWILNSLALERLDLAVGHPLPPGVEQDPQGRFTGRLYREVVLFLK